MTLEMNQIDGVRIRLPLACSAFAAIVLVGVVLLAIASWIVETNGEAAPGGASPGAGAVSGAPASAQLLEDRGRPGRRF